MWLVRLAKPAEQDCDKVYALKVLRKAEGECGEAIEVMTMILGSNADTLAAQLSSSSKWIMLIMNGLFLQTLLDILLLLH